MKKKISTQTYKKFQNDYLEFTNKKFVKKWRTIAKQNKRNGITEAQTIEQFHYEMQQAKSSVDYHNQLIVEQAQEKLKVLKTRLQDWQQNFQQHLDREKAKLPSRLFRKIDRWKAPLEQVKSRIEELKESITK